MGAYTGFGEFLLPIGSSWEEHVAVVPSCLSFVRLDSSWKNMRRNSFLATFSNGRLSTPSIELFGAVVSAVAAGLNP